MDEVIKGFLERNLPKFGDKFTVTLESGQKDFYRIKCDNGNIVINASSTVAACNGFYDYLKKYCGVELSWCGNSEIKIDRLEMFDGEMSKTIEQKFRVYMNYCTLDYTMCWWDFERWEKEIDFMAMNGINMPLAVVGTEAVWYQTLLDFGFTEKEALNSVSGPAFWSWQLMTNIEGYLPPSDKQYIFERAELGKKILARFVEFGMQPIQQGFSGHVPHLLKEKYPKAKIIEKRGWCDFPPTAQLDPLDPMFAQFGTAYLKNMSSLFGNYHYIACDPFHESAPPKRGRRYQRAVGKAIDGLYESFDRNSVWVIQAWTMRKHIVKAVPKERMLILDLNSQRIIKFKELREYPVVAGMLHDFGGKNAMQGKFTEHCRNPYLELKNSGFNVVGSGIFTEATEQNPVIYELQFEILTSDKAIEKDRWLDNYILRRYGKESTVLRKAWDILIETCYKSEGYEENEVGSALASRPQPMPKKSGPCDEVKLWYSAEQFEKAIGLFLSVSEQFAKSDGFQYDLCDLVRQALSNRFYTNQQCYQKAFAAKDINEIKRISSQQLELLQDLDGFLAHRSEMCLSRWINRAHRLASNESEKRYFDFNARTLITLWGDINGNPSALYDYSWREWNGLIGSYYYVRWQKFYNEVIEKMSGGSAVDIIFGDSYNQRKNFSSTPFGSALYDFELNWGRTYCEYPDPKNSDAVSDAKRLCLKWNIPVG